MKLLEQACELAKTGKCAEEIKNVTKEEVKAVSSKDLEALHEIMVGPHAGLALITLQNAGFFDTLIPEIQDGINIKTSKQFKKIWPHTIVVINQTPPKLVLRWAAMFHDLGKAKAFSIKNSTVTFHNHEHISAKIFDRFARRTSIFNRSTRNAIYFLVKNLGYVESYTPSWSDSAVRRFDKEVNVHLENLLALSKADITTKHDNKRNRILKQMDELRDRIMEIRELDAKKNVLPKGLGNEIAIKLNVPVGPEIGKLRKALESKIESGELSANENIDYYISYLKKQVEEEYINK